MLLSEGPPVRAALSAFKILGDRPTAGHAPLERRIGVRIPVPQPNYTMHAMSGPGRDRRTALGTGFRTDSDVD